VLGKWTRGALRACAVTRLALGHWSRQQVRDLLFKVRNALFQCGNPVLHWFRSMSRQMSWSERFQVTDRNFTSIRFGIAGRKFPGPDRSLDRFTIHAAKLCGFLNADIFVCAHLTPLLTAKYVHRAYHVSGQLVQAREKEGLAYAFVGDSRVSRHGVLVEMIHSGCSRRMNKNGCFRLNYEEVLICLYQLEETVIAHVIHATHFFDRKGSNREAFTLFQQHSTHLRKEREQAQAKETETSHAIKVTPRDPLLDYKRPRLVQLVREAKAECERLKRAAQVERAELEQRYTKLLQDHMQCGLTIARLEAELAGYRDFMDRFRSSLKREEHGFQN